MLRSSLVLAAVLVSCGGSGGAPSTTERSSAHATAADDGTAEPAGGDPAIARGDEAEPAARTTHPPGPAPVVVVRGTPGGGGQVTIDVENRGTELARLAPAIAVERERGDGSFEAVDGIASLTLRPDCRTEPPACVELAPGAVLHPPEWLGTHGDAQCICTRCAPVEAGTYRFVLTTCDGAHRLEGVSFAAGR